mmetsp:Transcript_18996/g.19720  ORF Transcript_18996/g.19720 Transcript_18996/m.19720 type:complete len:212 (-) Transcript_18996:41-676(-)
MKLITLFICIIYNVFTVYSVESTYFQQITYTDYYFASPTTADYHEINIKWSPSQLTALAFDDTAFNSGNWHYSAARQANGDSGVTSTSIKEKNKVNLRFKNLLPTFEGFYTGKFYVAWTPSNPAATCDGSTASTIARVKYFECQTAAKAFYDNLSMTYKAIVGPSSVIESTGAVTRDHDSNGSQDNFGQFVDFITGTYANLRLCLNEPDAK